MDFPSSYYPLQKYLTMKTIKLFQLGGIAVIIVMLNLTSCTKDSKFLQSTDETSAYKKSDSSQENKYNVFKGPQVKLGNGHIRSWVKLTHNDVPLEIGLEFTPAALTGLPEHGHMYHLFIPLHKKAKEATPYDHVSFMWNPEGHEPLNIFTLPHFDAHFMRITNEERMAIPEPNPGSAFEIIPPAPYIPQGYVPAGGVAQMGRHWVAPPLPAPGTFTSVMVYGSYNGKMIFEEPMVTLQHMLNGGGSNIPFGQPQMFHSPGYYPTKYNVYTSADGNYHITLSDFVLRQ